MNLRRNMLYLANLTPTDMYNTKVNHGTRQHMSQSGTFPSIARTLEIKLEDDGLNI